MIAVRKQLLAPNKTYWTASGPVYFSAADLKRMHADGKAMLKDGLQIPQPLEHQDNTRPLTPSERKAKAVLENTGWVNDFILDDKGNLDVVLGVEPDQRLMRKWDITREELADKLDKSIKFVSPEIHPNFRDGNGKTWKNVVTHVALTPRPVWSGQKPFSAPALLSLQDPLTLDRLTSPVRFSLLDTVPAHLAFKPKGEEEDEPDEEESEDSTEAKDTESDNEPPPDTDADDDANLFNDLDDQASPTAEPMDAPVAPETPAEPVEAAASPEAMRAMGEATALLSKLGVEVSPASNPEEYLQHMVTALRTHHSTHGVRDADDEDQLRKQQPQQPQRQPNMPSPDEALATEEPQMVSMSLQEMEKRYKEMETRLSLAESTLTRRDTQLATERTKQLRDELAAMETNFQLPPDLSKACRDALDNSTVQLSLVAEQPGVALAAIMAQVELARRIPKGTFDPNGDLVHLSHDQKLALEEIPPPAKDEPEKLDDEVMAKLAGDRWAAWKEKNGKK